MAMILSFEFDNSIKIIEASKKGQTLSVLSCMCIDGSCVKDGEIIDMDGTVNAIDEGLKTKGIKTKKTIFAINSSKIMVREIRLPFLKRGSEILSMIQIELQQMVSADLSKYKIMYEISNVTNENKILYAKYIVYCVPKILVSDYIDLAARLKLKLLKIDIFPNCINALYKNNIKINGGSLNNAENAVFINVNENHISFSAAHKGFCDFHISTESLSQLPSNSKDLSFDSSLLTAQIAKFLRYYYSVSGNRSIDKIYIYGNNERELCEAIKTKLNLKSEIIESITSLTGESQADNFHIGKYLGSVLTLFSPGNELTQKTNRSSKLINNCAYAGILLIIAAASTVLFGFFNSRAAMKNELTAMNSFIVEGKNNEIYSAIEGIKDETDYLKLYLQQAEELKAAAAENDYVHTNILREIYRMKPYKSRVTSIYSDKGSTQLICLSPSMSEAALFFSKLRGLDLVESANMPVIQSKSDQHFSYTIVLKLKK